jgi:hypothetical protein
LPERSKGLDSSSSVFVLVGSNPTECKSFTLSEFLIVISFTSLWPLAFGSWYGGVYIFLHFQGTSVQVVF